LAIAITGGNVTINSFGFTATNTATLNGASSPVQTATCGGLPGAGNNDCGTSPVLDPLAANAPGSTTTRTNNAGNPSELTSYGITAGNYSNSDSVINTAELVNLGSPTQTRQIAESLLNSGTSASANAEIQSVTGFALTFTVGSTANLSLTSWPILAFPRRSSTSLAQCSHRQICKLPFHSVKLGPAGQA